MDSRRACGSLHQLLAAATTSVRRTRLRNRLPIALSPDPVFQMMFSFTLLADISAFFLLIYKELKQNMRDAYWPGQVLLEVVFHHSLDRA
jgi:hypothetical protein